MSKVGILTLFYKTYNYGAQLQAFALQQAIEKLGYECEQIVFKWSKEETIEGYDNASINKKEFIDFYELIPHSKKVYEPDNIYECIDEYDIFVCGSDQIWGVENSMPLYKLPIMALSFVPESKVKIAYAASLGSKESPNGISEILKNEIKKLDEVSVRETSASEYLEELTGRKIKTVLDPVFLLEEEKLKELVNKKSENKYILYYTAGDNKYQRVLVNEVAKEYNLEVKQLGYIQGEKIGPKEFVEYIYNAEYIISDSFHATVLSIIFHKDFLTLPIDDIPTGRTRNTRLVDLLNMLGLKERFYDLKRNDAYAFNGKQILKKNIDYANVDKILNDKRKYSIEFIKNSLNIKKNEEKYLCKREECTGCGVCMLVCPNKCITMKEDKLGFKFAYRDTAKCLECGKCGNVCKEKIINEKSYNKKIIGLRSVDENIKKMSSSGGVFYELSKYIIERGGIVVGCRFDDKLNVIHDFCESINDLGEYCGSKYVQSDAYKTFEKIKEIIFTGKLLLFVGTPCQTHSLRMYIKKIPQNLIIIDLVCGGVGAPYLWKKYLEEINKYKKAHSISMRHKYTEYLKPEGYPAFSMKIEYDNSQDIFTGFDDLYLSSRLSFYREACYQCKYKGLERESDITIGDFCGMKEIIGSKYDNLGTTLVLLNSKKGEDLISELNGRFEYIELDNISDDEILNRNIMIKNQMKHKPQYYYLQSIFENSNIQRIYYENKYWDEFINKENILKDLYKEIKRNKVLLKIERFIQYNLWIDESPEIRGDIYIYGAGRIGKSLIKCTRNVKGFIDGNEMLNSCQGINVYHMETQEIDAELKEGDNKTVIVTPIWDYDIIFSKLKKRYKNISVLSIEDVVGSVWII